MSSIRMNTGYQMDWGPYANQADATINLYQFISTALNRDCGIVYCDTRAVCLLRSPVYDSEGFGYSLVVQFHEADTVPPTHKASPDFLDRVEQYVGNLLADYGRQQLAESEMDMQMAQTLSGWLSSPTHEHEIGVAFDVLGVVSFAMLFVPGIGEAEIGLIGAIKGAAAAGEYLQATGLVTAGAGFVGTIAASANDSIYLIKRYTQGRDEAEKWDKGLIAQSLSTTSFLLALPDLAIGSTLLIRDLPELSRGLSETRAEASALSGHAQTLSARAGRIDAAAQSSGDPALSQRVGAVTDYARQRAKSLTGDAVRMNQKAVLLTRKLYVALLVNGTNYFVGAPTMDSYFVHDSRDAYQQHLPGPLQSLWRYLAPHPKAGSAPHTKRSASLHVAVSRRPARQ